MERGISIIGQAPLGRYGTPSSPLSFKFFTCSSLAESIVLVTINVQGLA